MSICKISQNKCKKAKRVKKEARPCYKRPSQRKDLHSSPVRQSGRTSSALLQCFSNQQGNGIKGHCKGRIASLLLLVKVKGHTGMTSSALLLCYSDQQCRAQLLDSPQTNEPSEAVQEKPSSHRLVKKPIKKPVKKRNLHVSNGRVHLKISGYSEKHWLSAVELLQYMPRTKIRVAAKKILKSKGIKPKNQRRRRSAQQ